LIFVALTKASSATAVSGYKCIVSNAYELSRGGMRPHPFSELYRKREFIVDRITGRMLGSTVFSSDVWTGRHEVLDIGSPEQSFKAIYLSGGPYRHVRLLQIREYDDGPVKSFILTDGTDTLSGTCTQLK
jgi:hypothetical protein